MNKLTQSILQKFCQNYSQPQSMRRFYKESTFVLNPNPSHPLHKSLPDNLDILLSLIKKQ